MDHIKDELSHLGGMSSNDAFDLLTLGLFPDEEPEEEAAEEEDIVHGQPGLLPLGRGGRPGRGRPPPE